MKFYLIIYYFDGTHFMFSYVLSDKIIQYSQNVFNGIKCFQNLNVYYLAYYAALILILDFNKYVSVKKQFHWHRSN